MENGSTKKKAHLPVSRINTIMKSSSDVDTVDKESSLLMCKATELFIRTLALEGYNNANRAKKLDYKHLAEVVHVDEKYNFLRDIMPKKITVLEYKNIMARKEAIENDVKKEEATSSDSSDDEEDSSSGSDDSSASA
ncbi:chromatin accessibility complex protein 1 [Diorhabda carinulata]|uniref:chromatin accessibility complex protein 1 n=1 Tax=Diorhabda sublineata TaxID=1163346 RepID=UPI0024E12EDC|nr:chromatin accessibility complex protein 1 [Diorhabda sublineata]XP_057660338.1 chromatin accessibility complex protein 1 [Diorhabda carinulata]